MFLHLINYIHAVLNLFAANVLRTTVWPILLTFWFRKLFLSLEKRNETCPVLLPAALAVPCPKGWIGYQRKCYYFSETEGNWIFGSRHCSSHNASLVVIDSQEEMVGEFLLRYKSPPDHWIGLRKDSGQLWSWVNVSLFPEQILLLLRLLGLPTEEGRRCAYLNHKGIASSSCTREEPWICSREIT
ncbi:C-type lectin domain family 2 member B-like [Anolis carolinensis]|uniref:C-type lectin domain family 2 member B-like n=1 Tax=Anolis carolinensis TaxID=28377 RepID=UPI002F2B7D2C